MAVGIRFSQTSLTQGLQFKLYPSSGASGDEFGHFPEPD